MRKVLNMELKYTALKQLLTTALAISIGQLLLTYLPLGFNDLMEGYFRTLCVGYGLYAVANTMMLILLYFTDYKGALYATGMFAACTTGFTCISLFFPQVYYGFGFLLGSAVFFLICTLRLGYFIKKLPLESSNVLRGCHCTDYHLCRPDVQQHHSSGSSTSSSRQSGEPDCRSSIYRKWLPRRKLRFPIVPCRQFIRSCHVCHIPVP